MRASPSDGVVSSLKGSASRFCLLDQRSWARPSGASWMEARWISLSRLRLASSRGAAFTSSSNAWRIMLPIRITLAGCSTRSVTARVVAVLAVGGLCQRGGGYGAQRLTVRAHHDHVLLLRLTHGPDSTQPGRDARQRVSRILPVWER